MASLPLIMDAPNQNYLPPPPPSCPHPNRSHPAGFSSHSHPSNPTSFRKGQISWRVHLPASNNSPQSEHVEAFSQDDKTVIVSISQLLYVRDRLCGLVVSVADYKRRGLGFDSRALLRIFLRKFGLERGPLSLVIG
jgi:hypothetical protein